MWVRILTRCHVTMFVCSKKKGKYHQYDISLKTKLKDQLIKQIIITLLLWRKIIPFDKLILNNLMWVCVLVNETIACFIQSNFFLHCASPYAHRGKQKRKIWRIGGTNLLFDARVSVSVWMEFELPGKQFPNKTSDRPWHNFQMKKNRIPMIVIEKRTWLLIRK